MEHEGDDDTNCNWGAWNNLQSLGKVAGGVGNKKTNRYHSNYSIIEVVQNTEKSPGDLRRLAVTQTPVKDYQLMVVGKTHKD